MVHPFVRPGSWPAAYWHWWSTPRPDGIPSRQLPDSDSRRSRTISDVVLTWPVSSPEQNTAMSVAADDEHRRVMGYRVRAFADAAAALYEPLLASLMPAAG